MTSNDARLNLLERRVAYLESVVECRHLTMRELYDRRQAKLEYYRRQYEKDVLDDSVWTIKTTRRAKTK